MKGNGVKIVIAVVVLLVAVFVYLKYATSVFDSAPRIDAGNTNPDVPTPGKKPRVN